MTDYSDYRVWKKVELYEEREYLSEHEEYTPAELAEMFSRLMAKAESLGFEGCHLTFKSNMEPYEDYLGSPSVSVCGYSKLNEADISRFEKEDEIRLLAKEMGISEFQARVVYELKKENKL